MSDNKEIKDGLGNIFTIRMKDISVARDGSVQRSMIYASLSPLDYGAGGIFHRASKSGILAAGMAAAAPIYSFRWSSPTLLALIRRVRMLAWSGSVGFAAGMATFDMLTARGFTAQMTGGSADNLALNNAKLRTSMGSSLADIQIANTAPLTGGTFILDAGPGVTDTLAVAVGVAANTPFAAARLFDKLQGDMPLMLAQNEGFVVNATVPATGTWSCAVIAEWDEVPLVLAY
jgi:hypothetical protein